ncbi:CinA family protein [Falsihalocynthiibacter sp. SS001]|uniref:CinA family protein n=1 Tax=Falsihalocynthiibacter sp. SS001 TaxID=3349698 RepID=UPI0036D2E609
MSLARKLVEKAKENGSVIASAESCTGGMVGAAITDIAGSSAVFDRGFITYTNSAKRAMLNVSAQSLETFGAVSEQVAREMAIGAHQNSDATITVSITGIAGPGGSDFKPEGRVCFGLSCDGQDARTETIEFGPLGRENVRIAARDHALQLLLDAIS